MTYFVAGYGGNIAYTDDPQNGWELAKVGDAEVRAVVLKPDRAYAACADGTVYSTTSGLSWTLVHTFDHPVVRAAYLPLSGDILFALTDGWMGGRRDGYGWYEWREWADDNGVFAVAGLLEGETPATLEDVRVIIAGAGGKLATADGWYANPGWMQWTGHTTPFDGTPILSVARGDGMWVCGGGEGKLAYSPDGIDWTLVDSAFDGSCIYHIAFDMVLGWLAVGAEGKVSRSLDGVIWDAVDMAAVSDCAVDYSGRRVDHRWLSATAAGGCWMIAGDNNVVATLCECPDCYYAPTTGLVVSQISVELLDYSEQYVAIGDQYIGQFRVLISFEDGSSRYATNSEVVFGASYDNGSGQTVEYSVAGGDLFQITVSPLYSYGYANYAIIIESVSVDGSLISDGRLSGGNAPRVYWV